ncbi:MULTISPECIES: SAF domain-containing protein [unclassified Nocardioides]|uniref:SAF domain-containing protein n=1 Tax=unclassified Nocardioides TaxID=2615069 RepID=UPI0006F6E233|nr:MULTISPECIES: SAF domain-containing protein [unclassified Nocardioides]KQY64686.1 hypothetical protein ASD30_07220 [Nocardioides sp. Root140]KQZ67333.1 hypothetical protein ASD66_20485 [Nocardioides sp. Root151]KRF12589.1 hypothetical protein ASH02_13575 [Nocardioides sp. Soil796]
MGSGDGSTLAEQQRNRAFRRSGGTTPAGRRVDPPRQRRPGLAALAILLIVGGALIAGLLAVRMDSREPVLAAARDIPPGTLITKADLREVKVASEGLRLIPSDLAEQVLDGGTYAQVQIRRDTLIDETMLTREEPVGEDRAVVAVPLNPAITPSKSLRGGDLVQVIRVGGSDKSEEPRPITEAVVLSVSAASADDLGGGSTGSVSLLVPDSAAAAVVDAASADQAGLALLQRGASTDTELSVESSGSGDAR